MENQLNKQVMSDFAEVEDFALPSEDDNERNFSERLESLNEETTDKDRSTNVDILRFQSGTSRLSRFMSKKFTRTTLLQDLEIFER